MHVRSELINEVQKLVNLLEITSIEIDVFLKNHKGDPNLSLIMNYENKNKEYNKIRVSQPREFRRGAYSIMHIKNDLYQTKVVLGENEKKFEENIFNIANTLQNVINNNEIENYIKLAFTKYQIGQWDKGIKEVSFDINKSIEHDYSQFSLTFSGITFSSYKEKSVLYKNSFIEMDYSEGNHTHYTIDKAASLFNINSYDYKKAINSAERIRDYLFILDDINYYDVF